MEISEKEFKKRLNTLAQENQKIADLVSKDKGYGSYKNLPQKLKMLIDMQLGVTMKNSTILTIED